MKGGEIFTDRICCGELVARHFWQHRSLKVVQLEGGRCSRFEVMAKSLRRGVRSGCYRSLEDHFSYLE